MAHVAMAPGRLLCIFTASIYGRAASRTNQSTSDQNRTDGEMEQPTDAGLTLENFTAAASVADAAPQRAVSSSGLKTEAELDAELDAELNAELNAELTAEMTAGAAASSGDAASVHSGGKEGPGPGPDPDQNPSPPNFRNFL